MDGSDCLLCGANWLKIYWETEALGVSNGPSFADYTGLVLASVG